MGWCPVHRPGNETIDSCCEITWRLQLCLALPRDYAKCAADSCALCTATTRHEDEGQSGTTPYPCEVVQAQIKLAEHDFINFSPTFLSQCMVMARDVPMGSPLLMCAEPPSLVRTLVPRLVASHDGVREEGLPMFLTGLHPFYPLRQQCAVAAVHYVDGDGGVLVCEWFPGLHDACTRAAVCTQHIAGHNLHFVPFREANHYAIELGHTYNIVVTADDGTVSHYCTEYGYRTLVSARAHLSRAVEVYVTPTGGQADGRILVEVSTRETAEILPKANALRLIEEGLSFPTTRAPRAYREAMESSSAGVHEYGLGIETFMPWSLKGENGTPVVAPQFRRDAATIDCTVDNRTTRLNEAHVMILPSRIDGAGLGLFLRPAPSGTAPTVPMHSPICYYAGRDERDESDMVTTDYLFEMQSGSGASRLYNPETYDGQNIGRFVNQGGLDDGMKAMACACDRAAGSTGFHSGAVQHALSSHCNVGYSEHAGRVSLSVVASKRLALLTDDVQELYANYGYEYWLNFVPTNLSTLPRDATFVRAVLWIILSNGSTMDRSLKERFGSRIADNADVRQQYRDMACPFRLDSSRRRP